MLFALRLQPETEQFGSALLYFGEGGYVRANYGAACVSQHDSALLRFRRLR